jgi:N utilization substance protein B
MAAVISSRESRFLFSFFAMRNRTTGRELALKFLFMLDLRGPEVRGELTEFLATSSAPNEARHFAKELISGYLAEADTIDARVDRAAENWDIRRMATVDRNILRISTYELLGCRDTPVKVVINEAIEIGKKFGSSKSASFINGILDRIRRWRDQEEPGDAGDDPDSDASPTERTKR